MTRTRAASGWLAALAVAAAVAWGAGFFWFVQIAARRAEPPPPHADGIVALTGGAGRVELALHLLSENHADRLLLSGIGGGTELTTLGRRAGVDTPALAARITLGRDAASTRGNAAETAAWAAQNRIGSLIVVTASWHMPRAMAELRRALPDVRLFPMPVQPQPGAEADHAPGVKLEIQEFTKFLLAVSGLSAWLPHREAPAAPHPGSGSEA
nr:YdcF family protein [uncultured Rhodopila sp.]